MDYAELQTTSNFSFLRGASHPEELIGRAAELGLRAIALTDHNTLAGIVRAHAAAKEAKIQYIAGCRLELLSPGKDKESPPSPLFILVYPLNRGAYGRLCRLLTLGKLRAPKGECFLALSDYLECHQEFVSLIVPPFLNPPRPDSCGLHCAGDFERACRMIKESLSDKNLLSIALCRNYSYQNRQGIRAALHIARNLQIPTAAVNDVYYHRPERRALQDVLTCIGNKCSIKQAGFKLFQNTERYLKTPAEMAYLFSDLPAAVKRTVEISQMTSGFSLDQLTYEYPNEISPPGIEPAQHLARLVQEGVQEKYPQGVPLKVQQLIKEELLLIHELSYEKYFLTCHDIVKFARQRGILCQGRGAAANSAVCFCLGITAVDPDKIDLLLARFISKERNEPPDIDIDFEHERREEVIQYIYENYGRARAALVCEVITYRQRSAVRDTAKALGLSLATADKLAKSLHRWTNCQLNPEDLERVLQDFPESKLSAAKTTIQNVLDLASKLQGFPRHMSQHVGGFIICEKPLCEISPVLNASMPQRTIIEWDKDDIEAMSMLKIDILGLGMLSCIRRALDFVNRRRTLNSQPPLRLDTIPPEDPAVYEMLCQADTVGVFQVESRAQMSMLPRLKPRCFYDLVIEVAIVRPGPIQGNMVHPYLRRRNGLEKTVFPDKRVEKILGKTLGVPLFQEQAMRLAIMLANFTPGEAEQLRRAMAAWKKDKGKIAVFRQRIRQGLLSNGYSEQFAASCIEQIKGFSEYGFPESHAASFALLVYASAWLKKYYLAEFAAALLSSQPMGFYAPAQIISDAARHGINVRKIDVNLSQWESIPGCSENSVTLGLHLVKGLSEEQAKIIMQAVSRHGPFASIQELWKATQKRGEIPLPQTRRATLEALARADAFASMGLNSRQALWQIKALPKEARSLDDFESFKLQPEIILPVLTARQAMFQDYAATGFSLKGHPIGFIRGSLNRLKVQSALSLKQERLCSGQPAAIAGLIIFRQRPGTAKGVVFLTLEDETGIANLIIRPQIFEREKTIILNSACVLARGRLERSADVVYINVSRIESLDAQVLALREVRLPARSYSY